MIFVLPENPGNGYLMLLPGIFGWMRSGTCFWRRVSGALGAELLLAGGAYRLGHAGSQSNGQRPEDAKEMGRKKDG